jgi:hypothetical protein
VLGPINSYFSHPLAQEESMTDENLVIVAIPALVAILLHHEKQKGAPLDREEVLAIRDKAACMAMPRHAAAAIAEKRGYQDIGLETAWDDWIAIRPSLGSEPQQNEPKPAD